MLSSRRICNRASTRDRPVIQHRCDLVHCTAMIRLARHRRTGMGVQAFERWHKQGEQMFNMGPLPRGHECDPFARVSLSAWHRTRAVPQQRRVRHGNRHRNAAVRSTWQPVYVSHQLTAIIHANAINTHPHQHIRQRLDPANSSSGTMPIPQQLEIPSISSSSNLAVNQNTGGKVQASSPRRAEPGAGVR